MLGKGCPLRSPVVCNNPGRARPPSFSSTHHPPRSHVTATAQTYSFFTHRNILQSKRCGQQNREEKRREEGEGEGEEEEKGGGRSRRRKQGRNKKKREMEEREREREREREKGRGSVKGKRKKNSKRKSRHHEVRGKGDHSTVENIDFKNSWPSSRCSCSIVCILKASSYVRLHM